jgi:hypothetical protein
LVYDKNLDPRTEEEIEEDTTFFGAQITLGNVEKQFRGIATDGIDEDQVNNGWVQYSFYVSSQEDLPSTLTLSLGSSDFPTQGFVFFSDIVIDEIDALTYNDVVEDDFSIRTTAQLPDQSQGPEGPEGPGTPTDPINLWILIPSLILGVALLVSLVGYTMRRVKIRNPFKRKVRIDYSRETTLNEEVVRRELAEVREERLRIIDTNIIELNKVIEANKTEYESLTRNEAQKGKLEKIFNSYAKERVKLQKQLDSYISARVHLTDSANIRNEEQREIRRRNLLLQEENKLRQKEIIDTPIEDKKETTKKVRKVEEVDEEKEQVKKRYNPNTMTHGSKKKK